MRKKIPFLWTIVAAMALAACTTHYQVTGITRTRMLIDNQYDNAVSQTVTDFMKPFSEKVDAQMSPVLGEAAEALEPYRPESPLGNLLPDALMWAGSLYDEKPDFAVYNIGGMRASLAKGKITIGDVFEVAPFENYLCFVTLTGDKVRELMEQIAYRGGEGVSSEVRMVITKDNKLKRVTIGGKEIDPAAKYRIATIDYVSHGNDRMVAFKSCTDRHDCTGEEALVRGVLMKYVKAKTAAGERVSSKIEGRITVEE